MTAIKVCGLNNYSNLQQVLSLQPDLVGHIFYPKSSRAVGDQFLEEIKDLDYKQAKKVAVVVNRDLEDLVRIIDEYNFDAVQLHGDETPEYVAELKSKSPKIKLIKAFQVDSDFSFDLTEAYRPLVDYFLFDTKSDGYGGSGQTFSWDLLKKYNGDIPYILSGGLSPSNFQSAVQFATKNPRCQILDLNSGFESQTEPLPGIKNIDSLKEVL